MWKKFSIRKQDLAADQQGASLVELALFGAFIAIMTPAFVDLVMIIDARMQVAGSLRAGEQYALRFPQDLTGVENAVREANPLSGEENYEVDATEFCECDGVSSLCSQLCIGGAQLARYVSISATYKVPTNFTYPPFENPFPLSSQVSIRVQ